MTLLLGPPGCGKTSLLKALSGSLNQPFKFVPQKLSAYVSQYDLHIPEMTVRETLDFSTYCQGVGSRADILLELSGREEEARIIPDPDIDTYMKVHRVRYNFTFLGSFCQPVEKNLQTDYNLKILGLDICADTLVGDAIRRGISGGQKRRLTTGEMLVGPIKAMFMDKITNGLDISTSFQIVTCLQHLAHITDATILISLLQPSPETFDLFDDIILMAEGKIFCGFRCPDRKAVADFVLEVISRKDQAQYWFHNELPHSFVPVDMFHKKFKESPFGKKLEEDLSELYDKSESKKRSVSFAVFSLSRWEVFKACMSRELLLAKRNYFLYLFKTIQIIIIATMTMTLFLRTGMEVDVFHANYFMGSLFYALVILIVDGISEIPMTLERLAVFYKQKEMCLYPAWAYVIPETILKVPLSLVESLVWTSLTYYVIGFSPELWRFFRHFILLFAVHFTLSSMFRFLASIFRNIDYCMAAGSFAIWFILLFGGFIIPQWREILKSRGLNFDEYFFWISLGALFGLALVFNFAFALALSFLKPPGSSPAMISHRKFSGIQRSKGSCDDEHVEDVDMNAHPNTSKDYYKGQMILPFQPITMVFQDLQYSIDTPLEMRRRECGLAHKLQLLDDVTGTLRPGVLTALMGVSGAGKTTLLDVLAGRKTSGCFKGEIKVNGYPKIQETFVRVSGYCEQTDIHSPHITIEESLFFSAWLRLAPQINSKTKADCVNHVLKTIELDGIKESLVGIPGVSGLSTEQRKRLTIGVELVANPSIIFMDEPTTGLDARAAAIVMRAVKNVADTGRTIVCTIHQPSIDIFESFDELILLKTGGRIIYSGPLGNHSSRVIEYFEGIPGVPQITNNYNPATWMLEVTSASTEAELGLDFSQIYKDSLLYENNKELVRQLSTSGAAARDLHFTTRFSQSGWGQFKSCLWKQHLSYWRTPSYNLMRILNTIAASFLFGFLFWNKGKEINNQQDLFNILGSLYASFIFLGSMNCSSALPYAASERTVMYREQSAGMYSPLAYAFAQVTVEIPYLLIQAALYVIITYPMIGFYASAYKIFWNFYGMFCSMMSFSYLGLLLVALTPNVMAASILFSAFYTTYNLFAGFVIPQPQIPKWWIWLYYLSPTSWTLERLLTSQYGDIDKEIMVFIENKTIASFLEEYFGFHHDHLAIVAVALIVFPLVLASLFAFFVGRLNFQQR
ncbi:ABC transporter G family member 33 [Citrus sinensis]|uniref:ABC transporter G family member 33 n=1 Tax=Citrus sinensis TaxID=2711 RepID=A0ACB8JND9_CITSI|nr:ABC transporter G family member 33 [Citrus sinensis]